MLIQATGACDGIVMHGVLPGRKSQWRIGIWGNLDLKVSALGFGKLTPTSLCSAMGGCRR